MICDTATLTIRPLEERDLAPLARSLRLSSHHIAGRWLERQAGRRTSSVAELGGEVVGSVSFEERKEHSQLLHLYALAVAQSYQHGGIGARLVEHVEAEAAERGLKGVQLGVAIDNEVALRLYERLAYRRVGEPYTARWTWHGPDGEEREVVERCYRMLKRFEASGTG